MAVMLRGIINRRRERASGLGGTQDIAIKGLLITAVCIVGALVCGGMWLLHR
ncbi:MAG: hypothetical protein ACYDCO_01010 [Armatimonadota bacterium]